MKHYVIALVGIALISASCSEEDIRIADLRSQDATQDFPVCAPEEPEPSPRACIPEDKATYYRGLWKREFRARNGISEDYFDTHISSIWTSSICWNSGITFRVSYRITIDWAVIDRTDKIVVMLYSAEDAYRYLNFQRDVFLDERQISRVLDHHVFGSSVGPVEPLEGLPYDSCEEAIQAFHDSTGSAEILPTRIRYYVPGKIPREDGYPYFIGRGEIDYEANECIKGYFNLFTGESEAQLTTCWVE